MEKKYQAFVSSTYEDLQTERQAVIGTLLENHFIPVGMEQFSASPLSQWEYITKMIDSSDYYILIIAGRYGSIDPESNISYTEKEYRYAIEKGIPVLAFLHSDVGSIPSGKCEKTAKGRKMLEQFRETVKSGGRTVAHYHNADDLKAKVSSAATNVIRDFPRPGWIRADSIEKTNIEETEAQAEVERLHKEVAELKEALTWGSFNEPSATQQINRFESISNDASVLLVYAASEEGGEIIISRTLSGTSISTGKWNFVGNGGTREEARWVEAIHELYYAGYIERAGWKDEIYRVTHKGYELSDKIVFDCKINTDNNPDEYLEE